MNRFKRFALKRPLLFAVSLIISFSILGTLTYPIAYLFPDTETGNNFAQAIGKLIIAGCWLLLLWRWGWLRDSGFTRVSSGQMWLIVAIIGIYKIVTTIFAFTGTWEIVLPTDMHETSITLYALATGLLEELMVRALVLMAMIQAWGSTKRGLIKSVILSSAVFGFIHLFNLLVRSPVVVILQAVVVMLPGVFYAVLVLKYRSLWGVIAIHGLTNAFLNVKISTIPNFGETNRMWFIWALTLIPIVAYSVYELIKLPTQHAYPHITISEPVTVTDKRITTAEQPG